MPDFKSPGAAALSPEPGSAESVEDEKTCALCGLPVGRAAAERDFSGKTLRFCCPGCLCVFQVLYYSPDGMPRDYRQTELYRACVAAGLIPTTEKERDRLLEEAPRRDTAEAAWASEADPPAEELTLGIEGMWCGACSLLIENVLRKMRGVLDAQVFFLSDLAQIKYMPHLIGVEDMTARVSGFGYRAYPFDFRPEAASERNRLLLRLGMSAILTINIMMISFGLYGGFFRELGAEAVGYLSYPLWVLATPVVFYGGYPIFKRAFAGLRLGTSSMDTLIAVGTLSSYFYSVCRLFEGSLHLYFDTAAMLVTLTLLGRFIETQARRKVAEGIPDLFRFSGVKARLVKGGRERWVSSDAARPGDQYAVKSGESIPLDGLVISGKADVDESILTGESRPVVKGPGDEAAAGGLVIEGELLLKALRESAESSISRMASLMREALARKSPVELMADRVTRMLVPAVFLIAACAAGFLILRGSSIDEALLRGVTILVITCPCALGIAAPLAKTAAINLGRSEGIIVRDPHALEVADKIDTFVFDKTGTLTQGRFILQRLFVSGTSEEEALRLVGSVESLSDHFIAREVARELGRAGHEPFEVKDFESYEGMGVGGFVGPIEVLVGNRRLMLSEGLALPDVVERRAGDMESSGLTVAFFGWSDEVRGFMAFGDPLKEGAVETVSALTARGIDVRLVSGDSEETTRAVAGKLGVSRYQGRARPGDKVEIVRELQGKGRLVAMVGDGVNDAAALAQADLGIALGSSANIAREASHVALPAGAPLKTQALLSLSAVTVKTMRRNLTFAFLYNLFGIPLAVAGLLNPLAAVLAMFGSSLTVIGATMRISRAKTPALNFAENRRSG